MAATMHNDTAAAGGGVDLAADQDVIHQMLRVIAFADLVGGLNGRATVGWDLDTYQDALRNLARLGVNYDIAQLPLDRASAATLKQVARAALAAVQQSPVPEAEWGPMESVLKDGLPALAGVSASSIGRYAAGIRPTPDAVAARLHVLAQIVADLSGSYNHFGIRRWFQRPRQALGGRSPADILAGAWDPEEADVVAVRELAASLLGASAA